MSCSTLGLFSSASDPVISCNTIVTTPLYGSGLTIGDVVYTDSGCTTPSLLSFWSNGVNVYDVDGSGIIQGTSGCSCSQFFCVENDTTYEDTYQLAGTYSGYNYFTGQSTNYFIFYSTGETRWCLAQNLGDPCDQFGPYGSTSTCPNLDDSVAYSGFCVTTTTTINPCATFDYEAIFDCYVQPTPTITTTPSPTPTFTPTPSPTEICGGKTMLLVVNKLSPTPTPTPTPTPSATPQVTRPCNFSGEVIFNSINEIIQCANSKKFRDCFTGIEYYTSDMVLVSGTTSPKEGYVYNATINGLNYCVIFEGLFENISGVDNIELTNEVGASNLGACLDCTPIEPSPILECIVVHSTCGVVNVSPSGYLNGKLFYQWYFPSLPGTVYKIYWDSINLRWNAANNFSSIPGSYLYIDSQTPVGSTLEWVDSPLNQNCIKSVNNFYTTLLEVPCPSLTPTPTPTPSPTPCVQYQYRVTNNSPSKLSVQYTSCQTGSESVSLAGNVSIIVCSSTTPTSNNPQNVEISQLPYVC